MMKSWFCCKDSIDIFSSAYYVPLNIWGIGHVNRSV